MEMRLSLYIQGCILQCCLALACTPTNPSLQPKVQDLQHIKNTTVKDRFSESTCQCFANGSDNEAFCEGHNWEINRCNDPINQGRCHWGPTEDARCGPTPNKAASTCQCFANGSDNEVFCEGHSWEIDRCIAPINQGRCHWGPTEDPRCRSIF